MLDVERAVFLRGVREVRALQDVAAEAAVRAGAGLRVALDRMSAIALYVLERRALDPLGSRVLQGSLKRGIRTRRWRERHAARDANIYRTRRRDLLSQRDLAERFALTRAQIRGTLYREIQRLKELRDGTWLPFVERQRRWLIDRGLAPAHWKHPWPPGWPQVRARHAARAALAET